MLAIVLLVMPGATLAHEANAGSANVAQASESPVTGGISRAQTTNLAVVAPGIAEALLATAMGLVAAIPAVIFYNLLARATKAYVEQVGEGAGMMVRLLSRDLARTDRIYTSRAAE